MNVLRVIVVVVCWGLWQVTQKMATRSMTPELVQLANMYVVSALAPAYFLWLKVNDHPFRWNHASVLWTCATVCLSYVASYEFLALVKDKPLSNVMSLTQLYPLVSFALCWAFLGEHLTVQKAIGAVLLVAGAVTMNW